MDPKLQKLQEILKLVTESITREEFLKSINAVVTYVEGIKKTNETEFAAIHSGFKALSEQFKTEKDTDMSDIQGQIESVLESFNTEKTSKLGEIDARMGEIRQPTDGYPGKDADEEAVKNAVLAEIKIPTIEEVENDLPKLGTQIRDALELLQDGERLDASAIRNLPEFIKSNPSIAGVLTATALYSLADVNVAGITPGQSILWNGNQWISYTPASGGGSGYQQPTSGVVNGINTVFTFATAPNVLSVDGGRNIQKVSSDGTVNWTGTTTVTLSVAPDFDVFAVG